MQKSELKLSAFVVVIGLSSWWLNERISRDLTFKNQSKVNHIPAFYSKDMQLMTMNKDGQLSEKLISTLMTRFLDDQTTELIQPQYITYKNNQEEMKIVAEHGWISANNEEIRLKKSVQLNRFKSPQQMPLKITTNTLSIYPKLQYAYSDSYIFIRSENSRLSAKGMQFLFKTPAHFKLLSQVKGHYEID